MILSFVNRGGGGGGLHIEYCYISNTAKISRNMFVWLSIYGFILNSILLVSGIVMIEGALYFIFYI